MMNGRVQDQRKKYIANAKKIKPKKPLRIRFRKWIDRIPKIYNNWTTEGNSSEQIVPFLDRKNDLQQGESMNCEKIGSSNQLIQADNKKDAEKLIKMKTSHNLEYKTYPHEKLNTSKWVIRDVELSLATPEEMKARESQKDCH